MLAHDNPSTLSVYRFSSIPPKPLDWLWPSRIPRGKITLLAGDPGSGKTALLLDLAARLSTARPLPPIENQKSKIENPPEFPSPSATLLLSPEDNAADTLRPKLDALHANTDLIYTLPHFHSLLPAKPHRDDDPDLPTPLEKLDALLASLPNLALLAIDPITHYLGLTDRALPHTKAQESDSWASPRSLLAALAHLAEKHHIALLLTTRLTKKLPSPHDTSLPTLHRLIGSLAYASARTIHLLLPSPPASPQSPPSASARADLPPPPPEPLEPPTPSPPILNSPLPHSESPPPTHLLLTLKSNLAHLPPALPFTLADKITWHDPLPLATLFPPPPPKPLAPRIINENSALADAMNFLRAALTDGPTKVPQLQAEAALLNISKSTLNRAADELKIVSKRSGIWSTWFWSLPGDTRKILSPIELLNKTIRLESLSPLLDDVESPTAETTYNSRPQKKS